MVSLTLPWVIRNSFNAQCTLCKSILREKYIQHEKQACVSTRISCGAINYLKVDCAPLNILKTCLNSSLVLEIMVVIRTRE